MFYRGRRGMCFKFYRGVGALVKVKSTLSLKAGLDKNE